MNIIENKKQLVIVVVLALILLVVGGMTLRNLFGGASRPPIPENPATAPTPPLKNFENPLEIENLEDLPH